MVMVQNRESRPQVRSNMCKKFEVGDLSTKWPIKPESRSEPYTGGAKSTRRIDSVQYHLKNSYS